jgi:hypothetical protein
MGVLGQGATLAFDEGARTLTRAAADLDGMAQTNQEIAVHRRAPIGYVEEHVTAGFTHREPPDTRLASRPMR